MYKKRVAILRGGPSEEYDVSMRTGKSVYSALLESEFEPVDIVITKKGEWLIDGYVRNIASVIDMVDVVFIALHGSYGEDGGVQRILDRFLIPYTGSGAYASSIAMNKTRTKDILVDLGIKMPRHMVVTKDSLKNIHNMAETITDLFGPQYVIKPVASGSSMGVMLVESGIELSHALSKALENYDEVLVEERIIGKEATCGVVENFRNESLYPLPTIEIVPPKESNFFDTIVKYDGTTEEICPGRFTDNEKKEIEEISKNVHKKLGLSQYSRSDFMVSPKGEVYFLEVNTLPGLTNTSLLPVAVEAVGSTYTDFLTHLLTDALSKVSSYDKM